VPDFSAGARGILALDFDGVLWDSVDECREVSVRAWDAMGKKPVAAGELPARFRQGRPFCRTGHDFFVVMSFLSEDPRFDFARLEPEQFRARRASLAEEVGRFDELFYRIRTRLRDTDFALWSSWQRPVSAAIGAVGRLRPRFRTVTVATTKDSESVRRLLATAGVELPVIGREVTRDKGEQVRRIAEREGCPTGSVMLVDDLLENLRMAGGAGARGAMADWGYNTPGERARAVREGFPLIRRESVESDILEARAGFAVPPCSEEAAREGRSGNR